MKKVGDWVYSKFTSYQGEIEQVVEDGYIIKWWHNPKTNRGYAHEKILFGVVKEG